MKEKKKAEKAEGKDIRRNRKSKNKRKEISGNCIELILNGKSEQVAHV